MMGVVFFMICFLQPICLPLPEVVPYIFGSRFMNPTCCFLLGFIGTMSGIVCMYLLTKHITGKRRSNGVDKKKLAICLKYLRKHEIIITGLLFIIPIVPDEIICAGAGVAKIPFKIFVIVAAASKAVTVSMFAFSTVFADVIGMNKDMVVVIELILLFSISYLVRRRETKGDSIVME